MKRVLDTFNQPTINAVETASYVGRRALSPADSSPTRSGGY